MYTEVMITLPGLRGAPCGGRATAKVPAQDFSNNTANCHSERSLPPTSSDGHNCIAGRRSEESLIAKSQRPSKCRDSSLRPREIGEYFSNHSGAAPAQNDNVGARVPLFEEYWY